MFTKDKRVKFIPMSDVLYLADLALDVCAGLESYILFSFLNFDVIELICPGLC